MFKNLLVVVSIFISGFAIADEINWQNYDDARVLASDKPIFVFAKMRFCSACKKMEEEAFTDDALVRLLNENFIPVMETNNFAFSTFAFDDLKDKEGKALKFTGFPTVMVVMGQSYSMSQGYKSAEQLKKELTKVLSAKG